MERILFVASEGVPFVKTGGLADVIGSLPQALQTYEELEVRVMLPFYDEIGEEWQEKMEYLTSYDVQVGWRKQQATLYTLTHENCVYYFIANDYYFSRKGIYGYYDDGERFVFFSHAVLAALPQLDFKPDVLHAHDWQAGLAVLLAKVMQPLPDLKTVFTIHNLKYQGLMPTDVYEDFFQIDREHLAGMEWDGMINSLKAALFHADKITTVSPTYAEEIKQPYYGDGLDTIIRERKADLQGILNGIDTKEYNPLTDLHLPINYRTARSKKFENRELLQGEIGFSHHPERPLYVMVTRLVEQKGLHLVQRIMEEFLQEEIQFLILGTGEAEFEDYFTYLEGMYPDKVKTLLTFSEQLARRIYASADFLLMPSKFEPCGLSQLIALQYRTVPIVRETGGLKDTVTAFNEETGEGNGFSFTNYNAHELLHVLNYSLEIYHDAEKWKQLIKNVNKGAYTWKESAKQYKRLYEELVASTNEYDEQGAI
ncbi:glycogen synthase GlgA [Oceanobacillus alkalisoli]|uniref:glycogen synthase GlgA n=1 Tax=Oceanobacillus alkalisoli TaxID=2925113 RepID=UPI001F11D88F|nr:glycogen synthase GlgA [Oceanobacillus alkalisoli]MCF3944329.1 glycogen synthase GlgA [Oceanobacillus alkalisoli]